MKKLLIIVSIVVAITLSIGIVAKDKITYTYNDYQVDKIEKEIEELKETYYELEINGGSRSSLIEVNNKIIDLREEQAEILEKQLEIIRK